MTIHFACPVAARPSGGVEKIHQFAAALDRAGFDAQVVRPLRAPMPRWFPTEARVVASADVAFAAGDDILVLPEPWAHQFVPHPGVRTVILNQNAYFTFRNARPPTDGHLVDQAGGSPYARSDLLGVVCVSDDNESFLRFTFPDVPLQRVHYGIDFSVFHPDPDQRRRRIAFMPRRRRQEIEELLSMLSVRGRIPRWRPLAIDGMDQRGVAEALRTSSIFLAFPIREGFSLPSIEAMACGAIVIGYSGRGGGEYLRPDVSVPVADGDSVTFALEVERIAASLDAGDPDIARLRESALDLVHTEYTRQRQDREIVEAFVRLGAAPTARTTGRAPGRIPFDRLIPPERRGGRVRQFLRRTRAGFTPGT